jgi:8-oxo-dGTP diphosphatase
VWDVPGGHVEQGEQPIVALRRELQEELDIVVDAEFAVELQSLTPADDLTISTWLITKWTGEVSNRAPDEHDELGWFSLTELAQLSLAAPELIDLCTSALGLASTPTPVE